MEVDDAKDEDFALAELWVLANSLSIHPLQNLALRTIKEITEKTYTINTAIFPYVYSATSAGSQFRRFIVQTCVTTLESAAFSKYPENFPHQMLIDLAEAQSEYTKDFLMDRTLNVSDYYVPQKKTA